MESISVTFDFESENPSGKSPNNSDSAIRSLVIELSQADAIRLATTIIAQSFHPIYHNLPVRVFGKYELPKADPALWRKRLRLHQKDGNHSTVLITNDSTLFIGKIVFTVRYSVQHADLSTGDYTIVLEKRIEVAPGGLSDFELTDRDLQLEQDQVVTNIVAITPEKVWGYRPHK